MKCVKITNEKMLETAEIEKPISKNGSVVLKVNSCGICGSDIHYWITGNPKGLVMGHEFAGTVIDPGSRTDLKVGDRVTGLPISPCGECEPCKTNNPQYCLKTWSKAVGLSLENPGGYAEYTSCRPDMIKKLPDSITDNGAAMVEPSAVALHAVNLANIKPNDKVLIIGAGIIGLMTAEFVKLKGASYIGMLETNDARGNKAVNLGMADEYFSALKEDTITELSSKEFDVVIECCGNEPAVTESIMIVRPGGTVVLVGVSLTSITIPTVAAVMKEITMQGAIAYTVSEFEECIKLIADKKVDAEKYIDALVPLEEAQKSFERLTSGNDDAVKIMFRP